MNISSRTPEGLPSRCPLCGAAFRLEFSEPAKDAPCPVCGHLVWFAAQALEVLQRHWWDSLGSSDAPLTASTPLGGPEVDSLDLVELVMVLEEEFDLDVPVEEAEDIRSIGDVIRYLERRLRGGAAG